MVDAHQRMIERYAANIGGGMVDVAYLKQHYSNLATEELFRLRSSQLTDEARSVLEVELASRLDNVDVAERNYLNDLASSQIDESSLASLGLRLFAKSIDVFGFLAIVFAISFTSFVYLPRSISDLIGDGALISFVVYLLFKDGVGGQSVGKRLLGIHVIKKSTGEACSPAQSFVRNILCGFGVVDAAFALGRQRQRLGDLAAGTIVVRTRRK
jgi:uncharacterized RDD family membrane protein YckC